MVTVVPAATGRTANDTCRRVHRAADRLWHLEKTLQEIARVQSLDWQRLGLGTVLEEPEFGEESE